jgi:hypothetical protein
MENETVDPVGALGEKVTGEELTENEPQTALETLSKDGGQARRWSPEPTVLTLQDLIDLPRQIIPEETYIHLRNAGKEAILAIVSLVNGIGNARRGPGDGKIRRHIDVE